MKFILISLTILFFSLNGFSQSKSDKTIFKDLAPGEVEKLALNVTNYDVTVITELSETLKRYGDKIYHVEFNTEKSILKFTYNEFMLKQDLIRVFDQYQVSYDVNKKLKIKKEN